MSASAFKQLYNEMFKAGGDSSKLPKNLTKQLLKVFVKESHPYFLVSDSYFYVPCYFTSAAVAEFKDKHPSISISDLSGNVILITSWSLEMKRVDSSHVFSSYAGLEVRLIVNSFKPQLNEKITPTRQPVNLYRDDEMKTVIQHFRHERSQAALAKKGVEMPDFAKLGAKGSVAQHGVVAGGKGDDLGIKEGTTATVSIADIAAKERKGSVKKSASTGGVRVKGGAAGKRGAKAASKSAKKASAKKSEARTTVDKVLKYSDKKASTSKGKQSAKRSVSKKTPALPSPGGKKSQHTTDKMTMASFK